jgi:hypothetical protein
MAQRLLDLENPEPRTSLRAYPPGAELLGLMTFVPPPCSVKIVALPSVETLDENPLLCNVALASCAVTSVVKFVTLAPGAVVLEYEDTGALFEAELARPSASAIKFTIDSAARPSAAASRGRSSGPRVGEIASGYCGLEQRPSGSVRKSGFPLTYAYVE